MRWVHWRARACTASYAGIDPFDGLSATRLPGADRVRHAVMQLCKRSPADLRPLLGVRPRRIAKALGLIASGFALLQDAC